MARGERVRVPLVDPAERSDLMYAQALRDARTPEVRLWAERIYRARGLAGIVEAIQRLPSFQFAPEAGTDLYQGAVRTLREGGNCTAKTILGMSAAMSLEIPTRIGWLPQQGVGWDHVAPLYAVGGRLEWGETLLIGARLGEHPNAAKQRLGS